MAEEQPTAEVKYVASARTALADPESALIKPLPADYVNRSVKDVLDYLVSEKQAASDLAMARSIRAEMASRSGYTLNVNNSTVRPEDPVERLFVPKEHRGVAYQALEIEVSSVQAGGLANLLRA